MNSPEGGGGCIKIRQSGKKNAFQRLALELGIPTDFFSMITPKLLVLVILSKENFHQVIFFYNDFHPSGFKFDFIWHIS